MLLLGKIFAFLMRGDFFFVSINWLTGVRMKCEKVNSQEPRNFESRGRHLESLFGELTASLRQEIYARGGVRHHVLDFGVFDQLVNPT